MGRSVAGTCRCLFLVPSCAPEPVPGSGVELSERAGLLPKHFPFLSLSRTSGAQLIWGSLSGLSPQNLLVSEKPQARTPGALGGKGPLVIWGLIGRACIGWCYGGLANSPCWVVAPMAQGGGAATAQLSKSESLLIWAQDWSFSCGQKGLHPDSRSLCHVGTPGLQAWPSISFPRPELRLVPSPSPIS